MTGDPHPPRRYPGVMISSTFEDLPVHRAHVLEAIEGLGMHAVTMERSGAQPWTVVDSSLRMVRQTSAYIGIIGHRYGQVPESAELNPGGLSLTELEFREARRLGRPMLVFLMSADHEVPAWAVEQDQVKISKIRSFREEVKRASDDSPVHRVYAEFRSETEFVTLVARSISTLSKQLDERDEPPPAREAGPFTIPSPPALYAQPRYIGSHPFVGRTGELEKISTWAADPDPVLLIESIGGSGKSMLSWEWATRHAGAVRGDWAGTFWYSFYEKGAVMATFCRHALAYMVGSPLDRFTGTHPPDLIELLLAQLDERPWLLVLDGLERVLVAYHRIEASQVADEHAGDPDEIADRDPCAAIRPEDGELLRRLAGVSSSKILVTSRLVPQALTNSARRPIPGVRMERLAGLRPEDAEQMVRACDVHGTSATIRAYLQRHCDCHALVTGIVAGLVADYLPDRGHFDAWAADPDEGGGLDLAELDLVQKRNHILERAMATLPEPARRMLAVLAFLPDSVDYDSLLELNPDLPLAHSAVHRRQVRRDMASTMLDLERRGLVLYDRSSRRYDLHPVVRGVASGRIGQEDRADLGQRVVDHFTRRSTDLVETARSLDDLHAGLTVVRTLMRMGRMDKAREGYRGELADALRYNVEAHPEILSVLRPMLPGGWSVQPDGMAPDEFVELANDAALSLLATGERTGAAAAHTGVAIALLRERDYGDLTISLVNLAECYDLLGRTALAERCSLLALRLAHCLRGSHAWLFTVRRCRFRQLTGFGRWSEARQMWEQLDPMGRAWNHRLYRPGDAELDLARFLYECDQLTVRHLDRAERTAHAGHNRYALRRLQHLRARWQFDHGDYHPAANGASAAVRMAHEAGLRDVGAETLLATVRLRLGDAADPRTEAIRLASAPDPDHQGLSDLWRAVGDPDEALRHALAAHRHAWADGEPYVRRPALRRAEASLHDLGAPVPALPPYRRTENPDPEWLETMTRLIDDLRAGYFADHGRKRADNTVSRRHRRIT